MRIKSPHSGFAILFLFLFCLALLAPSYVAAQVDDANADFNRTKATADRFQRNELKIMARLLIAQALLRNLEQAANKQAAK
jgi:hypothetical protein